MKILALIKEFLGLDPGPDLEKCGGRCSEVYCERRSQFGEPQTPECRRAREAYLRQRRQEEAQP